MSCLHPSPLLRLGMVIWKLDTGPDPEPGLRLEEDIITAWRLSLSALSRRGLSDALCAITS